MTETINGIWNQWTADQYHQSSPKLARWLSEFLPKEEHVIDFGCGNAFYIAELAKKGFECTGMEGFPLNNFMHHRIAIHDLTKPIHLVSKGSVISLEVGEHLPATAEQTFLNSITEHCTGDLILSWALPGQPGVGHINCRPQSYIIDQVVKRGFKYCARVTDQVRANHIDNNTDWFRRTILIFQRKRVRP